MFDEEVPSLALSAALNGLANAGAEERGAVYTRQEVVEFILDLVGFPPEQGSFRILEPSFGGGDFLIPLVRRLLHGFGALEPSNLANLKSAVRAVELHKASFATVRNALHSLLMQARFSESDANDILDSWLVSGDFLLTTLEPGFDFVVGNPPYVRQELIPDALLKEYRRRFSTIYDRADLYIPFIEKSLSLLGANGSLGFICADRWMKNRYGGPLRRMVAENFHLKFHIDMLGVDAFHAEVLAYPAITVITRERGSCTRLAQASSVEAKSLGDLARQLKSKALPKGEASVMELAGIASGEAPWILESTDRTVVLRRLEEEFPTIEDAGCKVGIGVATGADKVFIAPFAALDVEASRKIPLVRTRDIKTGKVVWQGDGVINPFADDGSLVSLSEHPKLASYLEKNSAVIKARHVSKHNPSGWYRTIDRIYPALATTPKLLVPDIKGEAHIVFEEGRLYPHHNLYFITSEEWNLHALRAVLMSGIARLFVATYSTRMHGGFLRFQAQYLRRIRVPRWSDVPKRLQDSLIDAAASGSLEDCNHVAFDVFHLSMAERSILNNQRN
jgi:hypothetical protein